MWMMGAFAKRFRVGYTCGYLKLSPVRARPPAQPPRRTGVTSHPANYFGGDDIALRGKVREVWVMIVATKHGIGI